jgi:hypothetical protein
MVGPAGIEPATTGLEIRCSIQLSYGPTFAPDFIVDGDREEKDGGRYRIRTYDFHRVKMALYR